MLRSFRAEVLGSLTSQVKWFALMALSCDTAAQSRKRFSKKANESTPLPDGADLVAPNFSWCVSGVQRRPRKLENDLRRPVVIDVDQFTSPSQSTLLLPDSATCAAMTR